MLNQIKIPLSHISHETKNLFFRWPLGLARGINYSENYFGQIFENVSSTVTKQGFS